MIKINFKRTINRLVLGLGLLGLAISLPTDGAPPETQSRRLALLSADYTFNFVTWEIKALSHKLAYGLLAPERFIADTERTRLVRDYHRRIKEIHELARDIERVYTDPECRQPAAETAVQREHQAQLRAQSERERPVIEAIVAEQVAQTLVAGGFGTLHQVFPPVDGVISPLPYLLIISPRDHIESIYQRELLAGLTTAQQVALETRIEAAEPDLSACVTAIGGLSAYPAMLQETSSISWLTNVLAHEWTHHYLIPLPLGWNYFAASETRTINETTASLIGGWAEDETVRRCYLPQLDWEKPLPAALTSKQTATPLSTAEDQEPPTFDYYEEMHQTRVEVDQLLATGAITTAETYLEQRRRLFVEQGYRIRRLNQAYFAFHGAYASHPGSGGASGDDPVGPTVCDIWRLSATPQQFVRHIGQTTTLTEVIALKQELLIGTLAPAPSILATQFRLTSRQPPR
ncbi:MAG: hypothetical protein U9Q70_08930 [Chloroflexota bacterium]|nr:hypothetical protein [Chloroflexota bacterium]